MKVLVAITGASYGSLGLKLFENLPLDLDKHLIISDNAKLTIKKENLYKKNEFWQGPASGSFGVDLMFIVPCSMNSLAKIACGISDNLITRAASVVIKENKRLILAPREMPFSAIILENMLKLSRLNVQIAPPVIAKYSQPKTIEELEDFLVGKWLDLANIEHNLYKRWQ